MKTIQDGKEIKETNDISDGYHTFGELYKHRIHLFLALINNCKYLCYKSKLHDDGTGYEGRFIVQIESKAGQISYHLPIEYWEKCNAKELERANKWDGHTSDDVLERLLKI